MSETTKLEGSAETFGICLLFVDVVQRFGWIHGEPLPKRVLSVGDANKGWGMELNPTNEQLDDVPPFTVTITWNGWPAGSLEASGGWICAGELANESTFREWLGGMKKGVSEVVP